MTAYLYAVVVLPGGTTNFCVPDGDGYRPAGAIAAVFTDKTVADRIAATAQGVVCQMLVLADHRPPVEEVTA